MAREKASYVFYAMFLALALFLTWQLLSFLDIWKLNLLFSTYINWVWVTGLLT